MITGESQSARTQLRPVVDRSTTRVGFGTGGLLRIGGARRRLDILAAARASGITHFDTAPVYGFGESERTLGRFLRDCRSRVTLTTKFGLQPSPAAARLAVLQRAGRRALQMFPALRRAAVRNSGALYAAPCFTISSVQASLEASLRALRTDHVDFFLAHQACAAALPGEDLIGALERLRSEGKIRAFGVATEFEWLGSVLQQRPQLAAVVQFDSDPAGSQIDSFGERPDQLLITYGLIGRGVSTLRERLQAGGANNSLADLDKETLGGMLLRAAVLANRSGIVLMQSRSAARIERNMRAAFSSVDDMRIPQLLRVLEPQT